MSEDAETARLALRLLTQAELEAVCGIDGVEEPIVAEYARQALGADPDYPPWGVRLLLPKPGLQPIGHIRFQGWPAAGAVEFGDAVFPPWRRQGQATEAARALMRWAAEHHDVRRLVASVRPHNVASQRVVTKLGFRKVGQQLDDIDGIEDVFHLDR